MAEPVSTHSKTEISRNKDSNKKIFLVSLGITAVAFVVISLLSALPSAGCIALIIWSMDRCNFINPGRLLAITIIMSCVIGLSTSFIACGTYVASKKC